MERRGEETERGDRNRDIKEGNQKFNELVTDLAGVEAEIVAEEERRLNDRFGSPPAEAGPGLWESLKQAARNAFDLRDPPQPPRLRSLSLKTTSAPHATPLLTSPSRSGSRAGATTRPSNPPGSVHRSREPRPMGELQTGRPQSIPAWGG